MTDTRTRRQHTEDPHRSRALRGALLCLTGGTCWGLSGTMGQYLFTAQGMDSRWLVPIRLGLAGILLILCSLLRRGRAATLAPLRGRRDRILLLLYGVAGVGVGQFFYFFTIQHSSAATATILQNTSPVFVTLGMALLLRRAPSRRQLLSIVLAICGITLITTHGQPGSLAISGTALLSGLINAMLVALYNILAPQLTDHVPSDLLQGWSFLLSGAALALVFHPWTWGYVPTATGLFGIAFVVLVGNILAFTIYIRGVSLVGPEKAILYAFAEPVSAALIAFLFLGTPFTPWDAAGFVLIFAMLVLISELRA